jgi:hypothetical protein
VQERFMEYANRVLQKLTSADMEQFAPALEKVELKQKQILMEPGVEIEHVYFPLDCACSMIVVTAPDNGIEIGMFGPEGMSNMVVRRGDRTFLRTQVFLGGECLRVASKDFVEGLARLPSLNEVTLRFKETLATQYAFTSAANGVFSIEQRLARWILMAIDRSPKGNLEIVHDLMASMLSVRRSGVTTALHVLEGEGSIKATRGLITVRDRAKLEEIAGPSYGPAERAYDEIMDFTPGADRT